MNLERHTPATEEEMRMARMTLVVGMVGSDGIVLAADKRFLDLPKTDKEIDDRMDGRKIIPLAKHGVAYAFAGDFVSQSTGRELENRLDAGKFTFDHIDLSLEDLANDTIDGERKKESNLAILEAPFPRRLLVAFYGPQITDEQLWSLDVRSGRGSKAERIDGTVIAGARGNAARFFQLYFKYNLPVESLKFLAAHIVLAGRSWNGDIDGLDLVTVSKISGLKWVDEKEKEVFRDRFDKLDGMIHKFLLSPEEI
jgi:20S proteasome alpha/beta subunit